MPFAIEFEVNESRSKNTPWAIRIHKVEGDVLLLRYVEIIREALKLKQLDVPPTPPGHYRGLGPRYWSIVLSIRKVKRYVLLNASASGGCVWWFEVSILKDLENGAIALEAHGDWDCVSVILRATRWIRRWIARKLEQVLELRREIAKLQSKEYVKSYVLRDILLYEVPAIAMISCPWHPEEYSRLIKILRESMQRYDLNLVFK